VLPGQVSESSLHAMAGDGVPHGLVHHEPDAGAGRSGRAVQVDDDGGRAGPSTGPDRPSEGLTIGESMRRGQHEDSRPGEPGLRRPGSCGPCADGSTRWRGRRGCACAGGNRGSCDDDGCSAGTYACSRASLSMVFRDVHAGGSAARPYGWHRSAGTAHPRTSEASVVDMRHRSTPGDRPTVRGRFRQGQTAADDASVKPVDEALPAPPRACYVRPTRGSPPPSDQPDHDPL
jgi:hypothetical protein